MVTRDEYDVVVVGGGNAALSAALSARECGASVLVLERAPVAERGGNSGFTGGLMRFVYDCDDEIRKLVPDLSREEIANTDFGTYTAERFFDDIFRVTQYRSNPDLAEVLVRGSTEALHWLRGHGVRFLPLYGKHAPNINGKFKFSSGSTLGTVGGGRGLVDALYAATERAGIDVRFGATAKSLLQDDDGVHGVEARIDGRTRRVRSAAVVLACGGFQSNAEWRTRYLGAGWDLAKVRGTRYNTGEGIRMALDIGAQPYGNWSAAHAVGCDLHAPAYGDVKLGDGFNRHSYPYSIMVNSEGRRFLDEGADFRSYTYAKYGKVILSQTGQCAWQIYDAKVQHLLRETYRVRHATSLRADSLDALAKRMEGIDREQFLKTVAEYNSAVQSEVPFNPAIKDGRAARGLAIPKSNWANTLADPPFEAYPVTCGITFSFGGLKITTGTEVVDAEEQPIPGLYAAGELVAGIFYFNYPGGSGLTNGTVFGRLAGRRAAARAGKL